MSLYALGWFEIICSHIYRLTRALNHYKEICTVTCCEAICPLPLLKNSPDHHRQQLKVWCVRIPLYWLFAPRYVQKGEEFIFLIEFCDLLQSFIQHCVIVQNARYLQVFTPSPALNIYCLFSPISNLSCYCCDFHVIILWEFNSLAWISLSSYVLAHCQIVLCHSASVSEMNSTQLF